MKQLQEKLTQYYIDTGDIYDFKELDKNFERMWKKINDSGWTFTRNGLKARKDHPKKMIKKFIYNLIEEIYE